MSSPRPLDPGEDASEPPTLSDELDRLTMAGSAAPLWSPPIDSYTGQVCNGTVTISEGRAVTAVEARR